MTSSVIEETYREFKKHGTYAATARHLGVSPKVVANRVKWYLDFENLRNGKQKVSVSDAQAALDAYTRRGTFAAAARDLRVSPSTVSNRVARASEYGLESSVEPDPEEPTLHDVMVRAYLEFVCENARVPNIGDLEAFDKRVNKNSLRSTFGSMDRFHEYMEKHHSGKISEHCVTERVLFSPKRMTKLVQATKKCKRYVITTAVSEKPVHKAFYASLKSYCDRNDAVLLITMCQDTASRKRRYDWSLDPVLADEHVVVTDVKLNDNFFISSIKLSAKHINPLTGMNRIGQRNGSFVYASPKQFLTFVATSPSHSKIPHALMTPGAVTVPDYGTDYYMSQRTSRIAEEDHVLGAVIVEVESDKIFHFRQVQADPDTGSFIDLGESYSPDGSVETVTATLVLGDYHAGATDESVKSGVADLISNVPVDDVVLHDFFDGFCINHHDRDKPGVASWKAELGWMSIQDELRIGAGEINWLHGLVEGNLIMVKSNHDEILDRYLAEGAYLKDRVNYYVSLDLARKAIEGEDVLAYAYSSYTDLEEPDRIVWLGRDEEYKIGGVELGAHGDLGANGSRGSLSSIENAYGNCVVGHTHSAAIFRGVFRVGTSSRKDLHYNRGPSSWTHTSCLVYPNGSRQLINFIDGKWRA